MKKHGEHQLSAHESVDSEGVGVSLSNKSLIPKAAMVPSRLSGSSSNYKHTSVTRNRNTVLALSTQLARTLHNWADMAVREGSSFFIVSWTLAYQTVTFTVKRNNKKFFTCVSSGVP
jgi:hypothetical protein